MPTIPIKAFDGLAPKISPRLLPDGKAQIAQNVLLESGKIVPLKALSASVKTVPAGTSTIWRFGTNASDTNDWMTFTKDASVIGSPVYDDIWKRLYWSIDDGSVAPRYAPTAGLFASGIGPTGTTYLLGLPAPATAPIAAGSTATTTAFSEWDYMVTYTHATGDSAPSPTVSVKAPATRGPDWTKYPVTLTGIPVPETPAMYTGKKLWARVSGGATWNLVAELGGVTTTIFTDNVTSLGVVYSRAAVSAVPVPIAPIASLTSPLSLVEAVTTQYSYAYYRPAYNTYWDDTSNPGTGYNVYTAESVSALSVATSVSADASQDVTVRIPASAYQYRPTGGLTLPSGFAVFRKRPEDPEPVFIGVVNFNGANEVTLVDAHRDASTRYSALAKVTGDGVNNWSPPPALTSATASASTAFSTAGKVTYQYCQTFLQGSTEGVRSADSAYVTVAENGSARQQDVRLTLDPAPPGMTTRVYRRTVIITAAFGPLVSSVSITNGYKLLVSLAAGVGQFTDSRVNNVGTTALPEGSDLTTPEAPSGSFGASCTVPTATTLEARAYCYTYVTTYGEESPPSPVSGLADINPDLAVSVTQLPFSGTGSTVPTAYPHITKYRLYRSNAGTDSAAFQFVAEVSIGSGTGAYSDTVKAAELGEVLPSESWDAPPVNLVGLCAGGNGITAGFTMAELNGTSKLCFSEPYAPHAWPPEYQKSTGTKVVAMIPFAGNAWGILTTGYPYVAIGSDPRSISLEKIAQPQSCVSKLSAVATDSGVVYASPDGLCLLTPNSVQVLTESLYTRSQWQALNPSGMRSFIHNGRVLVFHGAGVLIFDFTGKSAILTTSAITAGGGYYDPLSDGLYLISGTGIVKWAGGADQSWTWKSKVHSLPQPTTFAWAQVEADSYPVTAKFYIGGTNNPSITDGSQLKVSPAGAAWTVTVAGREPFRMPSWVMYRDLEVELSGSTTVHSVAVSHSSTELAQV